MPAITTFQFRILTSTGRLKGYDARDMTAVWLSVDGPANHLEGSDEAGQGIRGASQGDETFRHDGAPSPTGPAGPTCPLLTTWIGTGSRVDGQDVRGTPDVDEDGGVVLHYRLSF